jgi:hypothetical protein
MVLILNRRNRNLVYINSILDLSSKNNGSNISKKSTSSSLVLLSLNDVCDLLKDGQHHPLFLLLLQQLQQLFNNDETYM